MTAPALDARAALSDHEVERYSRQLLLRELGEPGQLRLGRSRAAIVGCGGLGVPAALYLGAAGIGALSLIDPDRVALDNLQRQVAYRTQEVGEAKAPVLAARVAELNPGVAARSFGERLEPGNLERLLAGHEIVLECSDDPTTKFLVNDYCASRRIALVLGGAIGLSGQLLAVPPGGPCYRCLFQAPPPDGGLSCRDAGVLGPVVGVIGSLQALEAIRLLCGIGTGPGGRLLDFDAASCRWRELLFPLDPGCPAHVGGEPGVGHN